MGTFRRSRYVAPSSPHPPSPPALCRPLLPSQAQLMNYTHGFSLPANYSHLACSRRSVGWGAVRKTARDRKKEVRSAAWESSSLDTTLYYPPPPPCFFFRRFLPAPQLTVRLEQANHVATIKYVLLSVISLSTFLRIQGLPKQLLRRLLSWMQSLIILDILLPIFRSREVRVGTFIFCITFFLKKKPASAGKVL